MGDEELKEPGEVVVWVSKDGKRRVVDCGTWMQAQVHHETATAGHDAGWDGEYGAAEGELWEECVRSLTATMDSVRQRIDEIRASLGRIHVTSIAARCPCGRVFEPGDVVFYEAPPGRYVCTKCFRPRTRTLTC